MPSFEELSDLAQLVQPNNIKNLVLLGATSNPTTKLDKFYHGLVHQNFKGDTAAAAALFQEGPQYPAYYKLKERLYERLQNTLFFIDTNQSKFTENQKAYQVCLRQALVVKILLSKGARKAAIPIAEKALKKAEYFEFSDICLLLARDLRIHYSTIIGDVKKFKMYNVSVKKYLSLRSAELLAEEYYSELIINYVNSRATKQEIIKVSKMYCDELRELIKVQDSYRLLSISFLVFVLRFEVANDYKNTLKVCQEATNYFLTKKHLVGSQNSIFYFSFKMIGAHIQLKNYALADEVAKNSLELVQVGKVNWYTVLDYYLLLNLHSQQFQKANTIYQTAINHSGFNENYDFLTERWKIYGAFINYLILRGRIKLKDEKGSKDFRISKFLNEVPTYSKDKRGTNITILILHVLFLLQQQKYDEIIDRVESLKTYSHRYLRQDDTFRSNCFIKMLLQLPAASFHKKGVIRKAKKYWEKLLSVPLEKANQSVELEFIPYETLWEFVLDSLDNRFH